ncbi:MAG TPA: prolyl aminopeptidase [Rhabdochlamydiaceae bacterium]|nr:prolyl aminopeptidase [Rhabdochlamydiaceae bacterium]
MYPEIEPFRTDFLIVSEDHDLYWEESGNPNGQPILFLHGGPGSCTEPLFRRFFDPETYRIILMDQRGCGKSTPHASLKDNTTWHLVEDIDKLRAYLSIKKWIVFGGSWGSTLALCYAITHSEHVKGLILRGIFLVRQKELKWFYQFGAHHIFPDEWEKFVAPIPVSERQDLISAYYKQLTSSDPDLRRTAAKAWSGWEAATLKLMYDSNLFSKFTADEHADSISRIECHYFVNRAFMETDNWILENVFKIRSIPGIIVHGRYDVICPVENAWELHKAWPESTLEIVPDAGHAISEKGISEALVRATDNFKNL